MAFGTLKFDTLTTSDSKNTSTEKSIDTSYLFNGTSISWWQYDQTNATTDGSFNVSSISDDATGLYTPTLANAQANITDRSVQLTSNHESGDGYGRSTCVRHDNSGSFTTSAITVEVFHNDSYAVSDNNHNFGAVLGGLA